MPFVSNLGRSPSPMPLHYSATSFEELPPPCLWGTLFSLKQGLATSSPEKSEAMLGVSGTPLFNLVWLRSFSTSSTSTTMAVTQALIRLQYCGIQIRERLTIRTYLNQYSELVPDLEAMAKRALKSFPPPAVISLEPIKDRESNDQILALVVRYGEYPEMIMDHIDAINRIFDPPDASSDGWFYLTTDFQPPR